jgi:GNAT superfamily N-acetyltransferase/predicted GNAT family acetyltransferase
MYKKILSLLKAKNTPVVMTADKAVKEHKSLINVLNSPSHKDDKKEAIKQTKELKEYKEALNKGAMKRLAPFNPEDTSTKTMNAMSDWQTGEETQAREVLKDRGMDPNAKMRALHKLSAATPSRKAADGKREFLLHRGMTAEEFKNNSFKDNNGKRIISHKNREIEGPEEGDKSLQGASSWTPNLKIAHQFKDNYSRNVPSYNSSGQIGVSKGKPSGIASAWVHEDNIAFVPKQYGNPELADPNARPTDIENRKNTYAPEHEIIVRPDHNSELVHKDNVEKLLGIADKNDPKFHSLISPRNIDQQINRRSKTVTGPVSNEGVSKEYAQRRIKKSEPLIKTPADFSPGHTSVFSRGAATDLVSTRESRGFENPRTVVKLPNGMRYEHESDNNSHGEEQHSHFLFHPDHKDPVAVVKTIPASNGHTKADIKTKIDYDKDHQIKESKVDSNHTGHGYGKMLYGAVLRHFIPEQGKLWSDKQTSANAQKAWESFQNKSGVHGYIGRHPEVNPSENEDFEYERKLNFLTIPNHKHWKDSEHFPNLKTTGLPYSKPEKLAASEGNLYKGQNGDWRSEGYTIEQHPHPDKSLLVIHAKDKNGKKVGSAEFTHYFTNHKSGKEELSNTHIRPYHDHDDYNEATPAVKIDTAHRRKGLASAMYSHAEKITGKKIKDIGPENRTSSGRALWNQKNRQFGKSEENPHPGKIKDKEFVKLDRHVENMGRVYDKNPSKQNKTNLEQAHAARKSHIDKNPALKEHVNKLYTHLNSKYGGKREMLKSEKFPNEYQYAVSHAPKERVGKNLKNSFEGIDTTDADHFYEITALHNGQPVGSVSALGYGGKDLQIAEAGLNGKHQNRGVGKAMYEKLYQTAALNGHNNITTSFPSEEATRVHESIARKHGFQFNPNKPTNTYTNPYSKMDKSNYGPKGAGQYSQADNEKRKRTNTGVETGIQGIKEKSGQNASGAQGKAIAAQKEKQYKALNRKQPVKTFSEEEKKALQEKYNSKEKLAKATKPVNPKDPVLGPKPAPPKAPNDKWMKRIAAYMANQPKKK